MEAKFKNDKHYEERIVQALIVDESFAEQMMEVLEYDYFNLEHLKFLTEMIFEYHKKHDSFPSFNLLVTFSKDIEDQSLKQKVVAYLLKIKKDPLNGDLPHIKEHSLSFCKKRSLAIALEDCLDYINEEQYEQVVGRIQKAVLAGEERSLGHMFADDFEERMTKVDRKTIPTPWQEVNSIMRGGIGGGELAVLCAPTGVGKSHGLVDIGQHAASLGYNVAHYTFELGEHAIGNRYDARLSGIAPERLVDNKEDIKKLIDNMAGSVVIKWFPTKSVTTLALKNHVNKLVLKGMKPDLLVIDYGDLMRSSRRYDQKRLEEESIYEELRALAGELNVPIWTATQTNREGLDAPIVTLKHISECFGKAMIADVFITLARRKEQNADNIGNMHIAKSRLGPDGITFPMLINTSISKIQLLDPDSIDPEEDVDPQVLLRRRFQQLQQQGRLGES